MNLAEAREAFKKILDDYTNTITKIKDESLKFHAAYKMQWLHMDICDLLHEMTLEEWNMISEERSDIVISLMQEILSLCPNNYKIEHQNDSIQSLLKDESKINGNQIGFTSGSPHSTSKSKKQNKRKIGFIQDESEYKL